MAVGREDRQNGTGEASDDGNFGTIAEQLRTADCITCDVVGNFKEWSFDFIGNSADILLPGFQALFSIFFVSWLIFAGIRIFLQLSQPSKIGKEFYYIFITHILLFSNAKDLIPAIFNLTVDTFSGMSSLVLRASLHLGGDSQSINFNEIENLALAAESSIASIWALGENLWAEGGWGWASLQNYLYAFFLKVPYALIFIGYGIQITLFLFRTTFIAVLTPFGILLMGFDATRDSTKKMIKALIAAGFALFGTTMAIALITIGISFLRIELQTADMTDIDFFDAAYLMPLVLGWVGIAFMVEVKGLINSIADTNYDNNAAAMATGAIGATAAATSKTGAMAALKAIPYIGPAAQILGQIAETAIDRRGSTPRFSSGFQSSMDRATGSYTE